MPNQLPKNQNLSNFLSFRNEKQVNLIENNPSIEDNQDNRITNFILIITLFLNAVVSVVNYLNLTSTNSFSLNSDTLFKIEEVKSNETRVFELNKEVEYLKRYREAKNSITIKQGNFYENMSLFLEEFGYPELENLTFNSQNNVYNFKIVFFSGNSNIENIIKNIQEKNKKISNLKIESIERLSDVRETKYTITGDIDGR